MKIRLIWTVWILGWMGQMHVINHGKFFACTWEHEWESRTTTTIAPLQNRESISSNCRTLATRAYRCGRAVPRTVVLALLSEKKVLFDMKGSVERMNDCGILANHDRGVLSWLEKKLRASRAGHACIWVASWVRIGPSSSIDCGCPPCAHLPINVPHSSCLVVRELLDFSLP